MTRLQNRNENQSEFVKSRVGSCENTGLTRRDFLQSGVMLLSGAILPRFLANLSAEGVTQEFTGKRIYIAPDDHTDLFWSADLETYEKAFMDMLDYYLDLADQTQDESSDLQSRWNCDGSFWAWVYEKNKPQADFVRLIRRIQDRHISIPLNALCVCLGGAPTEAVLRGMYYPGKLERLYNLRLPLAYSMENQTLPFGLGALWTGSGATFSWKGICGCATQVPNAWDREHDIYWWVGVDGSRILMKWNSMLQGNQFPGGYAEARKPDDSINFVNTDAGFRTRYPYKVIGLFGHGWDDLQTQTDQFVTTAKRLSNQNFRVIVSNEIDFAEDFEKTYGNDIPSLSASFGNEWDLDCASMAEVSARVKRALEKLRTAESLATLVTLKQSNFMQGRENARDLAWMNLGLYWEHDWQGAGGDLTQKRIAWTKKITGEVEDYVNTLYKDALTSLGRLIKKSVDAERFFVFNPLSWMRTDYADYEYSNASPVHVIDLENGQEIPSQFVTNGGKSWLRILASNVPSVGYKVYEIRNGMGQAFASEINVRDGIIENQFYKVNVDGRGAITNLIDKTRGNRELAKEVNGRSINDLGASAGRVEVENDGPVSVTLLATADAPLAHTSRITLFRDVDRIEIQNDIDQNFNATNTWGFGFAIQNPKVHHEEVGAILYARLANQGGQYSPRNARYDWLTLNHFADIHQADEFGVTLSNADCYFMKLGNSTASELDTTTPLISVLVGGNDLNGAAALFNQGGDAHFLQRFALKTHSAYDPVSAMKFALEHQNSLVAGKIDGGTSYPEQIYSLLSVDNPNVLLWSLKPAEDGLKSGLVVRMWNVSNEKSEFAVSLNEDSVVSALSLTHIETPVGNGTVQNGRLLDTANPQQIKTYAIFPRMLRDAETILRPDSAATATTNDGNITSALAGVTETPLPTTTAAVKPGEGGKGCFYGLLYALGLSTK